MGVLWFFPDDLPYQSLQSQFNSEDPQHYHRNAETEHLLLVDCDRFQELVVEMLGCRLKTLGQR